MDKLRVLHFCNEDKATSWQRTQAFKSLGFQVTVVFHSYLNFRPTPFFRFLRAGFHKLGFQLESCQENSRLLEAVKANVYDVIFIEKCLTLRPSTIQQIRKIQPLSKIICYILDDFLGKGNHSFYFKNAIPLYDFIATNKEHNVPEYYQFGARKVLYFRNAFSPLVHKPYQGSRLDITSFMAEVCFIGTYEKIRADYLIYLANNGIKIKIWGWSVSSRDSGIVHPNIVNMEKHIYFEDFAKVIAYSKINLNFLRKANRDTETTRSIEIPACGGFMLAERTRQHQELFEEGKEAAYFGSKEELLEKVKFYLKNEELRIQIASNGRSRCLNSFYDYNNQLTKIINYK